ncbi:hypothetical protein Dimus_028109 [Dionaea muscipula]
MAMAAAASEADAPNDSGSANPCCAQWKARCSDLKEKRHCLRNAIRLLEKQIKILQGQIVDLKKECDEERTRANAEREEREKESCSRISLETELAALKCEISSLQKGGDSQSQSLDADAEAEVDRLKQLVEEERAKVGIERENAELEKLKASELKKEICEARSNLEVERSKYEEAKKKLEVEQQKFIEEKMRADANDKKAMNERCRADNLLKELQDEKKKSKKLKLSSCEAIDAAESQSDLDMETKNMNPQISENTAEVSRLKQLLEEEKMKVLLEREKAKVAENKVAKVVVERENAELEKLKASELKKEISEARSNLEVERSKYVEAKKKLEVEQQKFLEEKMRADANDKKAMEQRCRADNLLKELQDEKKKAKKLKKKLSSCETTDAAASQSDLDMVTRNMKLQISENAAEVSHLKQLLEEEKMKVLLEREKAKVAENKVTELLKAMEYEKNKVNEANKSVDSEAKKAKECRNQLEIIEKEVKEARSNLALEKLKYEDAMKKYEMEKQKALREKRCADEQKEKTSEHKRLMEVHEKIVMEERKNSANLLKALEAEKFKVEKLQKEKQEFMLSLEPGGVTGGKVDAVNKSTRMTVEILPDFLNLEEARRELDTKQKVMSAETFSGSELTVAVEKLEAVDTKRAMVHTWNSKYLAQQMGKARQRIEELEAELHQVQFGGMVNNHGSSKSITTQLPSISFLEEQLKFEKKQTKHFKQVAKLEKGRNSILCHELHKFKHEFRQMLHHLNLLDKAFSRGTKGVDNQKERSKSNNVCNMLSDSSNPRLSSVNQSHMLQHELVISSPSPRDASDCLIPTVAHCELQRCSEQLSGIKTKSDPLLGDSQRELLPSSAISSTAASFSNKQLVVSQGKVASSLATSSSLAEALPTSFPGSPPWSIGVHKRKHNDNIRGVAENSLMGSCLQASGHKKRKKILDEVESIKFMQLEGHRLHLETEEKLALLHSMLTRMMNERMEKETCLLTDQKGYSCVLQEGSCQKRNAAHETEEIMKRLYVSDDHISMETGGAPATMQAAEANGSFDTSKVDGDECLLSNQVTDLSWKDLAEENVMKLLSLDNLADEEIFLMAMERPLSPTLPEINFVDTEGCKVDRSKDFIENGYSCGDNCVGKHCTSNVVSAETNFRLLKCNNKALEKRKVVLDPVETNGSDSSDLNIRLPNETSGNCTHVSQMRRLDEDLGVLVQMSASNGANVSCGIEVGSAKATGTLFCVLFSDMDVGSAAKIFCAAGTCAALCFISSQRHLTLPDLLVALASEKHLTMREKVCVLFSLLLQHNYVICSSKFEDLHEEDFVGYFSANMYSVLSEVDSRNLFTGVCDLSELVNLIEDFVICKRIFSQDDVESELYHGCTTRYEISLDGRTTVISSKRASTTQFVAAGLILASICSALNQMHYIFDFTFSILHMFNKEPFLVLSILHVFAHVCQEKYLTMSKYSSLIAVVKSIVTLVENDSEIVFRPEGSIHPCFPPCARCPFSESSSSADDMLLLLLKEFDGDPLENLRRYASLSGCKPLYGTNEVEQKLNHGGFTVLPAEIDRSSSSFTDVTVTPIDANSGFIDSFCCCNDSFSLLELISSIMVWDWTCNKILPHLFKLLESDILGDFSVSVVLLLGQLGRLRIEASGYNYKDDGVEEIRRRLSCFLYRITTLKVQPSLVAATTSALFELSSHCPEGLLQKDMELLADGCHAAANDVTRNHFLSLSNEQKFFLSSLQNSESRLCPRYSVSHSPIAAVIL